VKKELGETRFRKKLISLKTTRKRVLRESKDEIVIQRTLKKIGKTLRRMQGSWILDGHTRDLIVRFREVIQEDLSSS
jgi:hypothetical protein